MAHIILCFILLSLTGSAAPTIGIASSTTPLLSSTLACMNTSTCTGGISSAMALIRHWRAAGNTIIFLAQLDQGSILAQMSQRQWSVNIPIFQRFGIRYYFARQSALTDPRPANDGLLQTDITLTLANILLPLTNRWYGYTARWFFEDNVLMIPLADETQPFVQDVPSSVDAVIRDAKRRYGNDLHLSVVYHRASSNLYTFTNAVLTMANPPDIVLVDEAPSGFPFGQYGSTYFVNFPLLDTDLTCLYVTYDIHSSTVAISNLTTKTTSLTNLSSSVADTTYYGDLQYMQGLADQALANNPVVGISLAPMPITRVGRTRNFCFLGECPLGNLFADAIRWSARGDIAVLSSGGLRGPGWAAGPVKVSDIWASFPFANDVCIMKRLGLTIWEMFNHSMALSLFTSTIGGTADRMLQVSGVRVYYNPNLTATVGRVIHIDVWNNATQSYESLERLKLYSLIADSFLCTAFDAFPTILSGRYTGEGKYRLLGDSTQDVVGRYMTAMKSFTPGLQGRLVLSQSPVSMDLSQTESSCNAEYIFDAGVASCVPCPPGRRKSSDGSNTCVTGSTTLTYTAHFTSSVTLTRSHTTSLTLTQTTSPVPLACTAVDGHDGTSQPHVRLNTSLMRCFKNTTVGMGSSTWKSYVLRVNLVHLRGLLIVKFLSGCPVTDGQCPDCRECEKNFTAESSGRSEHVPVGPGEVILAIEFIKDNSIDDGMGLARAMSRASIVIPALQVDMQLVYFGSVIFLATACTATAIIALIIAFLAWWMCCNHGSRPAWEENPKMLLTSVQVTLCLALWSAITGICWILIVALSSDPLAPLVLFGVGCALLAIGAAVLLFVGVWVAYDRKVYHCPACDDKVSQWRFLGTYIPGHEGTMSSKAHTSHILCTHCRKPVIQGAWANAPKHRSYHQSCWDIICLAAVGHPAFCPEWWKQQGGKGTDIELVHLLAAAVRHSAFETASALMQISPTLPTIPIADEGGCSALHLAARADNMSMFTILVRCNPPCLDPAFRHADDSTQSLYITGLDEDNDIYLYLPLLTFNDRPIYMGHRCGKYIFYYDPAKDEDKHKYSEGWCLSAYLGSGSNPVRLPLPDPCVQQVKKVEPIEEEPFRIRFFSVKSKPRQIALKQAEVAQPIEVSFPLPGADVPDSASDNCQCPRASFSSSSSSKISRIFPPSFQFLLIPHACSLLEEVIGSANFNTILFIFNLYRRQDPGCILWKYHLGHQLWQMHPHDDQLAIRDAMINGSSQGLLRTRPQVLVDFEQLTQSDGTNTQEVRYSLRASFQYRSTAVSNFVATSNAETVVSWDSAVVLFTPAHLALAAPNRKTLALLEEHGIVDYSLSSLPYKAGSPPPVPTDTPCLELFVNTMHRQLTTAMCLDTPDVPDPAVRHSVFGCIETIHKSDATIDGKSEEHGASSGIGNRLTDGLEGPQSHQEMPFYPPDYKSTTGVMHFCARLPKNKLDLKFLLLPITRMCTQTFLKLHEMQRQGNDYDPRHIVAIYIYTFEMYYEQGEDGDQIYRAMNAAMRMYDFSHIAFWQPLIWEIDQALQALPPYQGKCFRGINMQLDPSTYQAGQAICWRSFSSASISQTVAEEFAKGDAGTLFLLQSTSARPIAAISRFPEEEEVLFPPNCMFEITSTLHGTSDIGSFYARVDNIAMTQSLGQTELQSHAQIPKFMRPAGHSTLLLHVPTEALQECIGILSAVGVQALDNPEPSEKSLADPFAAELLMSPSLWQSVASANLQ